MADSGVNYPSFDPPLPLFQGLREILNQATSMRQDQLVL